MAKLYNFTISWSLYKILKPYLKWFSYPYIKIAMYILIVIFYHYIFFLGGVFWATLGSAHGLLLAQVTRWDSGDLSCICPGFDICHARQTEYHSGTTLAPSSYGFLNTTSCTRGLLLAPCSGIIIGCDQEIVFDTKYWTWIEECKPRALSIVLCLHTT